MINSKDWMPWIVSACVATVLGSASAQESAVEPAPAEEAAPQTQPSADDVMRDLLLDRRDPPVIAPTPRTVPPAPAEPVAPPETPGAYRSPEMPTTGVALNPAVLGRAPGAEQPALRREGEFIFKRRGRLVNTDGGQKVFAFEADSRDASEPPMILQPCRHLQSMEDITAQRGDSVLFILSGQVHVYRGANYLLPTMMTIAVDRGNLEN